MTLPRPPEPAACCDGKQAFAADQAKRVASQMRQRGKNVDPYQCRICRKWHIGSHLGANLATRRKLKARGR